MRNTFINNYRKNHCAKTSRDDTKELYYLNIEHTHTLNSPSSSIEYMDILKHANSLKDDLLTPFKFYTSGYKYGEVAKILAIPLGTVKNRIVHTRKEIQIDFA